MNELPCFVRQRNRCLTTVRPLCPEWELCRSDDFGAIAVRVAARHDKSEQKAVNLSDMRQSVAILNRTKPGRYAHAVHVPSGHLYTVEFTTEAVLPPSPKHQTGAPHDPPPPP